MAQSRQRSRMKHTRLWWVALGCFLAYWVTVKYLTSGVLAGQAGVGGSLLANLINGIFVYYFFLGLPLVVILLGASILTDVMVWRDERQEWQASHDN